MFTETPEEIAYWTGYDAGAAGQDRKVPEAHDDQRDAWWRGYDAGACSRKRAAR